MTKEQDILWYQTTWFTVLWIYLAAQAIIGIILIECSWSMTSRYRNENKDRDESYPTARRLDVGRWARWKFYPGAMLFLLTRVILFIVMLLLLSIIVKLLSIGHDFKKGPLKGCRKKICFFVTKWLCQILLFIGGIRVST